MYRSLETYFWTDPVVREFDPDAKLLFLYLLTSPHSHLSGLYYMPMPILLHETGLPADRLNKAIDTLSVGYRIKVDVANELVWVVNMLNYQPNSPKILACVGKHLQCLHKSPLVKELLGYYDNLEIPYRYPIDRLTSSVPIPNTVPSIKPKSKKTRKRKSAASKEPPNEDLDTIVTAWATKAGLSSVKKVPRWDSDKWLAALNFYGLQWCLDAIANAKDSQVGFVIAEHKKNGTPEDAPGGVYKDLPITPEVEASLQELWGEQAQEQA